MADFMSKLRLPVATEHKTHLSLSCDHVTTMNWGKLKPLYIRPLCPKQSINVDVAQNIRLAPLQKPFYGSCQIITRAFFIPARTIMRGFNEFVTNGLYIGSDGNFKNLGVPTISMTVLQNVVKDSYFSTSETIVEGKAYDYKDDTNGYILNERGKYLVDILRCLGYQINMNTTNLTMNALPFLSFLKLYYDWFTNTNFDPTTSVAKYFNREGPWSFTLQDFTNLASEVLYAPFANDYFTASWKNPNSPIGVAGFHSQIGNIVDSSTSATQKPYITFSSGTPIINSTNVTNNGAVWNLSKYILTALNGLTDYMKRNQLAGWRALDRFQARFGVTLPDAALDRSKYLGKSINSVNVSDVTSQADTDYAVLGDYSGFGISRGANGNFSYSTDEYGYFIIMGIITPVRAQYAGGIHRYCLDTSLQEAFYVPELDGLGCQAIAKAELKADFTSPESTDLNGTANFIPRYGSMKVAQDFLSGDFMNKSRNAQMEYWHTFRTFDDADGVPTIDRKFCQIDPDTYDRIFNVSEDDKSLDHFICQFHFNVKSVAPMSPLFENYHFDEEGYETTLKVGGTKLD